MRWGDQFLSSLTELLKWVGVFEEKVMISHNPKAKFNQPPCNQPPFNQPPLNQLPLNQKERTNAPSYQPANQPDNQPSNLSAVTLTW